jgi:hypothetical protein
LLSDFDSFVRLSDSVHWRAIFRVISECLTLSVEGCDPAQTETEVLLMLFGRYGEIVKMVKCQTYYLIQFSQYAEAVAAQENLNQTVFKGQKLVVTFSTKWKNGYACPLFVFFVFL